MLTKAVRLSATTSVLALTHAKETVNASMMIVDFACPEIVECEDPFWYFNRLACQCFRATACDFDCPAGLRDSPVTDCDCW